MSVSTKQPAEWFFPTDWLADLATHPVEIRGVWITLCAEMMRRKTGTLTLPLDTLAAMLLCPPDRTVTYLDYLAQNGIGNFPNGVNGQDPVTVVSRRLSRLYSRRESDRLRKQRERESTKRPQPVTPDVTGDVTPDVTPHSNSNSNSNSLSNSKDKKKEPLSSQMGKYLIDLWNDLAPPDFAVVLKATPERIKKATNRVMETHDPNPFDPLAYWKEIIARMKTSAFLKGDNDRGWKANFDWMLGNDRNRVPNHLNVMEGKYDGKPRASPGRETAQEHTLQRMKDLEDLKKWEEGQ